MPVCGYKEAHKPTQNMLQAAFLCMFVANRCYLAETHFRPPHYQEDNDTQALSWWRISPLSFLSTHSDHPAVSYSWQLSPGMCRSQTARLFNFSQETLWDDNIHSVMSHFLCLPHVYADFISVLKKASRDMLTCSPIYCMPTYLALRYPASCFSVDKNSALRYWNISTGGLGMVCVFVAKWKS